MARRRQWQAEWIYERDDNAIDRSIWTGDAKSEDDARERIKELVERYNEGASGTLKIGNLRSVSRPTR